MIKIYIVLLFSCSDAEKVKKCVDENMSKCSDTLKWQVMTMEKLNMMVIGEMCKFDMKVKNQVEKAREMYAALIEFMTNGKLYLYSCVSVGRGGMCVLHHIQQYCRNLVPVCFINGGNWRKQSIYSK